MNCSVGDSAIPSWCNQVEGLSLCFPLDSADNSTTRGVCHCIPSLGLTGDACKDYSLQTTLILLIGSLAMTISLYIWFENVAFLVRLKLMGLFEYSSCMVMVGVACAAWFDFLKQVMEFAAIFTYSSSAFELKIFMYVLCLMFTFITPVAFLIFLCTFAMSLPTTPTIIKKRLATLKILNFVTGIALILLMMFPVAKTPDMAALMFEIGVYTFASLMVYTFITAKHWIVTGLAAANRHDEADSIIQKSKSMQIIKQFVKHLNQVLIKICCLVPFILVAFFFWMDNGLYHGKYDPDGTKGFVVRMAEFIKDIAIITALQVLTKLSKVKLERSIRSSKVAITSRTSGKSDTMRSSEDYDSS